MKGVEAVDGSEDGDALALGGGEKPVVGIAIGEPQRALVLQGPGFGRFAVADHAALPFAELAGFRGGIGEARCFRCFHRHGRGLLRDRRASQKPPGDSTAEHGEKKDDG